MSKNACNACPWLEKGQPLVTDDVRQACHEGQWFACHGRGGGDCIGAKLEFEKHKRKNDKETKTNSVPES